MQTEAAAAAPHPWAPLLQALWPAAYRPQATRLAWHLSDHPEPSQGTAPAMAQVVQLGRTLLSPFTSVASWYNRTAEKAPFTVGFITTGLKTSAADLFAQKVVERRDHVDWQVGLSASGAVGRCIVKFR